MEIKKINKKLDFEVEAQEKCCHGYEGSYACHHDCQIYAFAMSGYEEWLYRNTNSTKCYFWGYNYVCQWSHKY